MKEYPTTHHLFGRCEEWISNAAVMTRGQIGRMPHGAFTGNFRAAGLVALAEDHRRLEARADVLEAGASWRRIDGPGVDGQRVMLRELDPFDRFNRGDENRDAIASGYWSDDYEYYVWPFGCTDHPPTHWAPMPDRLVGKSKEGGSDG